MKLGKQKIYWTTKGQWRERSTPKITQADLKHRQELMARMNSQLTDDTSPTSPVATPDPYANLARRCHSAPGATRCSTSAHANTRPKRFWFNPYPNIHQSVVQPLSQQAQVAQQLAPNQHLQPRHAPTIIDESTSENKVSPDIISLANNSDLSVETLAREANRLSQKKQERGKRRSGDFSPIGCKK